MKLDLDVAEKLELNGKLYLGNQIHMYVHPGYGWKIISNFL